MHASRKCPGRVAAPISASRRLGRRRQRRQAELFARGSQRLQEGCSAVDRCLEGVCEVCGKFERSRSGEGACRNASRAACDEKETSVDSIPAPGSSSSGSDACGEVRRRLRVGTRPGGGGSDCTASADRSAGEKRSSRAVCLFTESFS